MTFRRWAQLRHQFAQSGQVFVLMPSFSVRPTSWIEGRGLHRQLQGHRCLPWQAADGSYVVLAKVEEKPVQDPVEARPLVLSREQFEAMWSGALLLFAKRAPVRLRDLQFDFTWFVPAIVKYRKLFGEVLIASFFLQLFALLTPLFTQVVIDKVLVHKGFTTLHVLAIGMITLAIFEAIVGGLRIYLFSHTTNRIDVSLGSQLFRHILALPMSYFEARRVGDTVARVRELEQIRQFLTSHSVTVVLDVVFTAVFLTVMWLYSPMLSLVVMASLPVIRCCRSPLLRQSGRVCMKSSTKC